MSARKRLVDLISYVEEMHRLSERVVTRLQDYRDLVLHETDLKAREGIQHDLVEGGEAVWLKIDRLRRTDPPEPPQEIGDWIAVSRDPSQRVTRIPKKVRTVTLQESERLVNQGLVLADDVMQPLKEQGDGIARRDVILRPEHQPGVMQAIETYVEGPWLAWAERERPRRGTIEIYEKLFALEQTFEAAGGESAKELVWGVGLARWHRPPVTIDHCLIEQLVEIEIDPHDAALRIRPRSAEPFAYLKPFLDLDLPGAQITLDRARKILAEPEAGVELSPFQPSSYEPVLRLAATQLDTGAVYYPDVRSDHTDRTLPPIDDKLIVSDHWVIYARTRADNFLIQDLTRLKDAVGAAESDEVLPPAGRRLVEPPDDTPLADDSILKDILKGGLSTAPGPIGEPETYPAQPGGIEDEAFFFPKPFNKEQMEIVRRLEKSDGLVVQGPPGTGKTHTIANLICHYLAMGRRVLVTAQSEAALTVLRGHLPPGVRELAVALLTSERDGLKQLERAAAILATEATQVDGRRIARDIQDGQQRIVALRRELAGIDRELEAWARKHLTDVGKNSGDGTAVLPMELARKVAQERDDHAWFVDRPSPGEDGRPQVTDAEIQRLVEARRAIGRDLGYLGVDLPPLADLPSAAELSGIHDELVEAERLSKEADRRGVPPLSTKVQDALERAERIATVLRQVLDYHDLSIENPWLAGLLARWMATSEQDQSPTPLDDVIAEIEAIAEEWEHLVRKAVRIPDEILGHKAAQEAIERLASASKPFSAFSFGKDTATAKDLLAGVKVSGERLTDREQARSVVRYLSWRRRVIRCVARWNALWLEYGLPEFDDRGDEAGCALIRALEAIRAGKLVATKHGATLRREVPILFPNAQWAETAVIDRTEARAALEDVQISIGRRRLAARLAAVFRLKERFAVGASPVHARFRTFLSEDLGNPSRSIGDIANRWRELSAELERIHSLEPYLQVVSEIAAKIKASGAPVWAKRLREEPPALARDPLLPSDWISSWRWAQFDRYLTEIDGRDAIKHLSKRRLEVATELQRRFAEVVRLRTFAGLKRNMTRAVEAALMMFVQAVRRIGAGTGVRAIRHRRTAREAMQTCARSVPCWIMPAWRVSEYLPPALGAFDLVIVDEASQADARLLPALLRGHKLLVVGDDKQVSPDAVAIEERRVLQLEHDFLKDQPFKSELLPGSSLYDLMRAIYPGQRLMLREHFRCVEPIIRFSMQFYDEPLEPLRVPTPSQRLDPPLIDILVQDGEKRGTTNRAEAQIIVDAIERLATDQAYRKRTIGVISLIGRMQAALIQKGLLERVGEEAFLRHQIACGDAATFQGKERDIMFLSMVASPGDARAFTTETFKQRFNVAMSRARDRMYLVRSVNEGDLRQNDLKAMVIRHFKNPMPDTTKPVDDMSTLCESKLEKEVYKRLIALGYRVQPQVSAGGYRIDLVVEGEQDRRLAIELDGDKYHGPERWADDFNRQQTLERMGWRFWRCWGSSFVRDTDGCMSELVATLTDLGIEPLGNEPRRNIYTQHVVLAATAQAEPAVGAPAADQAALEVPIPATAAPESEAAQNLFLEVGDRVVARFEETQNQRTLILRETGLDLNMGIITLEHPLGKALLNSSEDDEIEYEFEGRVRRVTVLKVQKGVSSPASMAA